MTSRTLGLISLGLAAAMLTVACSSGGGGGGGGGGGDDETDVVVVPNQFSAEAEQEVELTPSAEGVATPSYMYTLIPPTSLADADAATIASEFGAVDAEGVFVAGAEATDGARGSIRVLEQTSGAFTDVAVVIVPAIAEVVITPESSSLLAGQTVTFRATATDFFGDAVSGILVDWRTTGDVGTIGTDGVFRGTAAGDGNVTATVGLAPTASAAVTVVGTVTGLSITPLGNPVEVEEGTTRQFRAVVSDGSGNQTEVTATWALEPAALGTVSTDGLFTAGASGQTGVLRATAQGQTVTVPLSIVDLITPPDDQPGNIIGQVTNQAGEPVAGAVVTAVLASDASEVDAVSTDADGAYGLFLPAGAYRLEAAGTGGTAARTVTLASQDVRLRVDLRLAP